MSAQLLSEIEWKGTTVGMTGGHGSGPSLDACPSCGGAKPCDAAARCLPPESIGHKPTCELAAMIDTEESRVLTVREWLDENFDGVLTMDGFDDAIIGVVERFGFDAGVVAYDKEKVIEILMRDMTRDEALEFYEFNQVGAWMGDSTPVFIDFAPGKNATPYDEVLSLDEAIAHAEQVAVECDCQCSKDHRQLAEWLRELKGLREERIIM